MTVCQEPAQRFFCGAGTVGESVAREQGSEHQGILDGRSVSHSGVGCPMVTIRRRAASIYDLKCHEGFAKLAGGFPLRVLMLWPLISLLMM